jgi:hypothetical protein
VSTVEAHLVTEQARRDADADHGWIWGNAQCSMLKVQCSRFKANGSTTVSVEHSDIEHLTLNIEP